MPHMHRALVWLLPACILLTAAHPAAALSTKECGVKYRAAKKDGSLGNKNWAEFRKAQCGDGGQPAAAKADKAKPAEPKVASGPAVFPAAISAKYSSEKPAKQRFHTCLDQYRANKATGNNGGLKWVQKGGGYLSQCTKKLKA